MGRDNFFECSPVVCLFKYFNSDRKLYVEQCTVFKTTALMIYKTSN